MPKCRKSTLLRYNLFFMRCLFYLFLMILTTGCGRLGPFRYKTIEIPCTSLTENIEEAAHSESFTEGDWPSSSWWEMFGDPQLARLIEVGLSCNPSIRLAEARMALAYQQARDIRADLFPWISSFGQIYGTKVSKFGAMPPPELGAYTEADLKIFGFRYQLDLWKKYRKAYWAGLSDVQAARADEREAELLLSTAIAQAYLTLQGNLARKNTLEELLANQTTRYQLIQEQFLHGVIAELLLYDANRLTMTTEDLLIQIQGQIEENKHALDALVGNTVSCCSEGGKLVDALVACFNQPFCLPCSLPLELVGRRPEIVAQKWSIKAAGYRIGVAKAQFYPNIDLIAWAGFQSLFFSELFTDQSAIAIGNVAYNLPIYQGGRLQANLGVAKESYEIAIETYNGLILTAVQEVSDSLTALITADNRNKAITRSVSDAEEIYHLTQEKFENGVDDYLSVLYAKETVLEGEDLLVQIHLARHLAIVELIRALGGGYDVRENS